MAFRCFRFIECVRKSRATGRKQISARFRLRCFREHFHHLSMLKKERAAFDALAGMSFHFR
jgi:hypothetical protein